MEDSKPASGTYNVKYSYFKAPGKDGVVGSGGTYPSCEDMRRLVGAWLRDGDYKETQKFWDLITCLRGPDSPSERDDQAAQERSANYNERRRRKYDTVEVIRHHAFFGVVGGSARWHKDDKVTLPPRSRWDHFDKHVSRAADVLGLKVEVENE